MRYKKLYKALESYDYVSFDIFDTLIKRDIVNPKDLFGLIEKKLISLNIDICNYANKRVKAERDAREQSEEEEITLEVIYDFFKKECNEYDDNIIEKLIKIEQETEIEVSTINLNMKPILEYCREKNKKIILISDMYLDRNTIERILERNNIVIGRDYIKLFLSSESQYTKRSGRLYDEALKYLNIESKKLFHIGDSLRGDYLNPIKKGIKAYHIPTKVNNSNYKYIKNSYGEKNYNEEWLDKFISNRILKIENDYEKFGYECIGPLLYGFSVWLYESIQKNKYKKINFLAREGLFLQKAFKIIYPKIETRYLCVSRKSIIGAMLGSVSTLEERLKMIKVPHAFDKNVVIDLLGIQLSEENINKDKIYHSIEEVIDDKEFFEFLRNKDNEIIKKSNTQLRLLEKYLQFDKEFNEICIVDIGWNGTMQYYLKKLLEYTNQNKKINGYYMGVSKVATSKYPGIESYGYLFDKIYSDNQIDENKLFSFCGLFESIFTADHGSVKNYYNDKEEVKAIFYEYEYEDNYKIISKIQKGALSFIQEYSQSIIKDMLTMDLRLISSKILRVGNYPRKYDLKMFESLDFFDVKKTKMIGEVKLFENSIREIHNEFLMSGWKVGFIKRLIYTFPASTFYCKYRKRAIGG